MPTNFRETQRKIEYQKKVDALIKVNIMLDKRSKAGTANDLGLTSDETNDIDAFILTNVKRTFLGV